MQTSTSKSARNKTKAQLLSDLESLSRRVAELENSPARDQQTEIALSESEDRYRRITQTLTDYIYTVRVAGGRAVETAHGPACVAVTGYTSEDFTANPDLWLQMVDIADRPAILEQARRLLAGQDAQPVEHRITRKDGKKRWVRNTPVPYFDPDGHLIAYDGLIQDITERRQAQEELAQERNLLRTLVDSIPDLVYAKDSEGRFILKNEADILAMGAGSPSEVIGKTDFDYYPREIADRFFADDMQVIRSGQLLINREEMIVDSQGSERWLLTTKIPLSDGQGNTIGLMGIGRDITESRNLVEALRESEGHYRAMIQSQVDLISRYLPDTTLTFVNDAYCRFFGKSREELIGNTYLFMIAPEYRELVRRETEDLAKQPRSLSGEYVNYRHDGEACWIQWVVQCITGKDDQVVELQAVGRDITKLKQAEAALEESKERFRNLVETVQDWIWEIDPQAIYTYVSPRARDMIGFEPDDLLGKSLFDTMLPDEAGQTRNIFQNIVTTRRPFGPFENTRLYKDGHPVILETSGVPFCAPDGTLMGYRGVDRNITERKRAEALIRAQRDLALALSASSNLEAGLRLCLDTAIRLSGMDSGGIYLVDTDSGDLNLAVHQGLTPAFIANTSHFDADSANVQIVMTGKPIYTEHVQLETPLNSSRQHENLHALAVIPIRHEGQVISCLNVASHTLTEMPMFARDAIETIAAQAGDVIARMKTETELEQYREHLEELVEQRTAELKEANDRLLVLSRVKDEFVSNVSHELQTPISSLKLRQYLLENRPDQLHEHLSVIKRETERLARTIEDLLQLSRLDQNRIDFRLGLVDFNTLASQYVADRQPIAANEGLTLSFHGEPELPGVMADTGLLGQALSILLTNAISYTPAGGRVSVATHTRQVDGRQWVGFSISDTGLGISPEEQTQLFTRFFRGKAGRESGVPGTGLGLSIVKQIIDRHSGSIEIESGRVPDHGTTFRVWIPIEDHAGDETYP
ncbi:MAG: PAS domain S-box protein [Anaerolineae bacterium]|nr:PAS domain S-box protein [Anaerolineae bacterium]